MPEKEEISVKIHVETIHRQDDQQEEYAEDFNGQLIRMGESLYLRYQEELPENVKAKVTFKIDNANDEIQLTRKLENQKLHLIFKPGKRIPTRYQTPYGIIPLEVFTGKMESIFEDDPQSGELQIDYRLFNGDALVGDHKIRLQFTA